MCKVYILININKTNEQDYFVTFSLLFQECEKNLINFKIDTNLFNLKNKYFISNTDSRYNKNKILMLFQ